MNLPVLSRSQKREKGMTCALYNCCFPFHYMYIQGNKRVSVHLKITTQKTRKNNLTVPNAYHENVVNIRDNRWR
jgi:hypothetical protein